MKVTLDLSKLLEEGKLSPAEAERLRALAAHDTGSFAINVLVGFGVVAVSAGAVALVPTPVTALMLGLVVFAIGLAFALQGKDQWSLLAQICLVVGTLMFSGGVLTIGKGALASMLRPSALALDLAVPSAASTASFLGPLISQAEIRATVVSGDSRATGHKMKRFLLLPAAVMLGLTSLSFVWTSRRCQS
jgi:iron complex transport system permease protein